MVRGVAQRLVAVALVALGAGCSSLKPYPNDGPIKNVTIRTAASAGSVFSSVKVELDVHGVDASCATRYLGTLQLGQPTVAVSLPPGRGPPPIELLCPHDHARWRMVRNARKRVTTDALAPPEVSP